MTAPPVLCHRVNLYERSPGRGIAKYMYVLACFEAGEVVHSAVVAVRAARRGKLPCRCVSVASVAFHATSRAAERMRGAIAAPPQEGGRTTACEVECDRVELQYADSRGAPAPGGTSQSFESDVVVRGERRTAPMRD